MAIILTHELGHACAARAYGLKVHALVVLGIGGFCVSDRPTTRRSEIALYSGGTVGQIALFIVAVMAENYVLAQPSQITSDFLFVLTFFNALIALGNLLPIVGTDAGALLRVVCREAA
jgi:Zn-dependent protease